MVSVRSRCLLSVCGGLVAISTIGCGAALNHADLQAQAGAPLSTQSEAVRIPFDPGRPTFVLAIEPFVFHETLAQDAGSAEINIRRGGEELAAKFTTALANVGNFSIIDSGLSKSKNGAYIARLKKGEVGPYIVRATVSEFTEVAEASSSSRGGSLGFTGALLGIAGAVTRNSALGWTGVGLAAANPTYRQSNAEQKGMVGIDFRIVDGRSGRVVAAFKSTGTFKSAAASKGVSLFGIGGQETKFAQSVVGQALTVALNDAVRQLNTSLTGGAMTTASASR